MSKYQHKNYASAVSDFDRYLASNPTDKDIILLRGLSKSLLMPEDVVGACADFLVVRSDQFAPAHLSYAFVAGGVTVTLLAVGAVVGIRQGVWRNV
jgi:outer membrane protein assembly factor BamD (BamD/ComL family)